MDIQQRVNRILNTSKIIYIEDMSIHNILNVECVGDNVYVNTGTGLLFQDSDIFTLEEACDAERYVNKIKESLYNK